MLLSTMFSKGYTVVVGSMWGDVVMQGLDHCADYEEEVVLESVDSESMTAYFYEADFGQYDD